MGLPYSSSCRASKLHKLNGGTLEGIAMVGVGGTSSPSTCTAKSDFGNEFSLNRRNIPRHSLDDLWQIIATDDTVAVDVTLRSSIVQSTVVRAPYTDPQCGLSHKGLRFSMCGPQFVSLA